MGCEGVAPGWNGAKRLGGTGGSVRSFWSLDDLGGLPKLKPIGLPILPVEDPNANEEGFEDGTPPKGDFVGVDVDGLSPPKVKPPLKAFVEDSEVLSSFLLLSFELSLLNRLLEKTEGVLDGKAELSAGLLEASPKEGVLGAEELPKVKADCNGAVIEPPCGEDEPNAKELDFVKSNCGLNPPLVLAEDVVGGALKPVKAAGGVGIVGAELRAEFDGGFVPREKGEFDSADGVDLEAPKGKGEVVVGGAPPVVVDEADFFTLSS